MVEIYLNFVRDLLDENAEFEKPKIQFDKQGQAQLKNIKKFSLDNIDQALSLYQKGVSRRETGSTNLNAQSSRSHLIFAVEISYLNQGEMAVNGRLTLIDLAGCEKTKESISVNQPNYK